MVNSSRIFAFWAILMALGIKGGIVASFIFGSILFVWGLIGIIRIQTRADTGVLFRRWGTVWWAAVAYGAVALQMSDIWEIIYVVSAIVVLFLCVEARNHEHKCSSETIFIHKSFSKIDVASNFN